MKDKQKYGSGFLSSRKSIFARLVQRDGYQCTKCKCNGDKQKLTIDHIKRIKDGGTNDLANLQLLCLPCHQEKDNLKKNNGYKLFEIAFENAGIDVKSLKLKK